MNKSLKGLGAALLAVALMLMMGGAAFAAPKKPLELWREGNGKQTYSALAVAPAKPTIIGENMKKTLLYMEKGSAFEVTVSCPEGVKSLQVIGPEGENVSCEELVERAGADGRSKVYTVQFDDDVEKGDALFVAVGKTGGRQQRYVRLLVS